MKAVDAANVLIARSLSKGCPMIALKLHKELYLAHGVFLAMRGTPLIDEPFVARISGPVCQALWPVTKAYMQCPIEELLPGGGGLAPTKVQRRVLQGVFDKYQDTSTYGMIGLVTRLGSPWESTYNQCGAGGSDTIPDEATQRYFQALTGVNPPDERP